MSHQGVYHKQKRKLRVLFNCSLQVDGVSRKKNLEQGLDLTSFLMGVLLKFREKSIAVTADIKKMFYQVKVSKGDGDLLRFFWYDSNNDLVESRLIVHVFGATSSPSVANFVLRKSIQITIAGASLNL